jgi:hypothetical protein
MSFDVNKYASKVLNAQGARIDRDFIQEGDHVVKIEAVVSMTSENTGNDLIIIESEILSTKGGEHRSGDKVKQIFTLSGVQSWKVDENIGKLKSIVLACLPTGAVVDATLISNALQGGSDSALAGDCIRVIAKRKTSKKGAEYLSFSYARVDEEIARGWTAESAGADYVEGGEPVEGEGNYEDMPF